MIVIIMMHLDANPQRLSENGQIEVILSTNCLRIISICDVIWFDLDSNIYDVFDPESSWLGDHEGNSGAPCLGLVLKAA